MISAIFWGMIPRLPNQSESFVLDPVPLTQSIIPPEPTLQVLPVLTINQQEMSKPPKS